MSNEPPDQEKRSREIADKIRAYLTALNTGGIAITFGVAGSLASQKVRPAWTVWPVVGFVVGLILLGASLFLAKHKALKRRADPKLPRRVGLEIEGRRLAREGRVKQAGHLLEKRRSGSVSRDPAGRAGSIASDAREACGPENGLAVNGG